MTARLSPYTHVTLEYDNNIKLQNISAKQAFCIVRHLQAFLKSAEGNEFQYFTSPCRECEYAAKCESCKPYEYSIKITREEAGPVDMMIFWKNLKIEAARAKTRETFKDFKIGEL